MVWRSARGRRIAYQAAALGGALLVAWFLISNTMANLEERRIASGFGFLQREAGFEIGESALLTYSASDSYLRAWWSGSPIRSPSRWWASCSPPAWAP
jgi:general L-amino acid transport system permease protein